MLPWLNGLRRLSLKQNYAGSIPVGSTKRNDMEKINVELQNLNQISEEYIASLDPDITGGKKGGLLKVTTETYYRLYETDDEDLKRLASEWFDKYGSQSHAYRDGSKLPLVNLVKVEIVKR